MTANYLDRLFPNGPRDGRPVVSEENLGHWLVGRRPDGRVHWRDNFNTRAGALQCFRRNFDLSRSLTPQLDAIGHLTDGGGIVWELVPDIDYDPENDRRSPSEPTR